MSKNLIPSLFDEEPDPVWGDRWIKTDREQANTKPFGRQDKPTTRAAQSFDEAETTEATREAIERADTNANPDWKNAFYESLVTVAERTLEFSADEIWEHLLSQPGIPAQHEPRAAGAVILRAVRAHVIKIKPNYFVKSRRRSCHSSPIQVYESLIYQAAPQ